MEGKKNCMNLKTDGIVAVKRGISKMYADR